MALTDNIVTYLMQDTQIVSYTSNRVYPFDVRMAGPGVANPVYTTAEGYLLTSLIVDDSGGVAALNAPSGATRDRLHVWILAESNDRLEVETLADRLLVKLHRYQDPTSKAILTYAERLGIQPDPPASTGILDRITFTVGRMVPGVST